MASNQPLIVFLGTYNVHTGPNFIIIVPLSHFRPMSAIRREADFVVRGLVMNELELSRPATAMR